MDHDLTRRVERAALGAMIADRQLAARLGYLLEPADFTDPRHQLVFRTASLLSIARPNQPGNWGELIAKTAGRHVSGGYLAELAAACPDPAHGPGYAAMLVQAAVYRQARGHAGQMDDQANALAAESARLRAAGAPGSARAARLSALLTEVAGAVRAHTAMLAPPDPGPTPPEPSGPAQATATGQRERLVLAAVLQEHPQAGQILSLLPAAAFTAPDRQEIFRAARRLDQSGRPVDELTVSWELATRSAVTAALSPGSRRQAPPDGYIARLARTRIAAGESPLRAARDLDAQLRHRTFLGPRPGARNPDQAQDAPARAVVVPLIRPRNAPEARPAGPEQSR